MGKAIRPSAYRAKAPATKSPSAWMTSFDFTAYRAGTSPIDYGRALPNGLELSCPAARASAHSLSRIPAGKASPTFRTPAGSAAARGCVKTPNSPIAFPLRPQEPGVHTPIAPTSCFLQCHSWGWRPTGPSFHTVWRVVGQPAMFPLILPRTGMRRLEDSQAAFGGTAGAL
jgi:hypothetical protein